MLRGGQDRARSPPAVRREVVPGASSLCAKTHRAACLRAQRGHDEVPHMCATVRTLSCHRWMITRAGLPPSTEGVYLMKITKDRPDGTVSRTVQSVLLSLILVGGISAGSALARGLTIEIAPPAPQVEVIPTLRPGYAWAPGYWNWQRNQHVWVKGHSMRARNGYDWAPDRWNQVNNRHEFERSHWTRHTEHGQ